MLAKHDVIVDVLGAMTAVIEMGELLEASYEDGIPLTNHQAREISRISEECIKADGFYTMNNMIHGRGTVFTFYTRDGLITHNIILNFPDVAEDRKIPSLATVRSWFDGIWYHKDRMEIKMMYDLIGSHIRDGGHYDHFINSQVLSFTFRMNDKVKSRYEFHREDLSS